MPSVPFRMQNQEMDNWCWAAVSVSVDRFFAPRSTLRQCRMAQKILKLKRCTGRNCTEACDQPWYLDKALRRVGRLRGHPLGRLKFAQVQQEIDNGVPVCVRIGWRGGGGHFVVITGYSVSGRSNIERLQIKDPLYADAIVNYKSFVSSYRGAGRWTDTFLIGR